jgi:peptide/nickel transport system substrate-binding protein
VFGYADTTCYTYDPDKARELLADAGYADGLTLTFLVPQGRYLGGEEASTLVQAYLADVGVTAEIEVVEWATYLEEIDKAPDEARFHMGFIGFSPSTNDADWMLYTHYHCDSMAPASNNSTYTCDPAIDELLDAGRFNVDPAERKSIYADVLNMIVDSARDIYLFEEAQITGVSDTVHGLVYLPVELFHLEWVWLE